MYLFTEYVFRESVDSAHNSQISSTFQEADCLLKLVKINKQVFAITLLSRNLNHTAKLSLSARGENNNFVSRAGGVEETEKTPNWFKLAHFGDVITPFLTIETLYQFNFIDFSFHLEMHICYLYSMIDSNIIFGFWFEK